MSHGLVSSVLQGFVSAQKAAYDGLIAMIEKMWAVNVDKPQVESNPDGFILAGRDNYLDSSRD